jgi:hypothetical protein
MWRRRWVRWGADERDYRRVSGFFGWPVISCCYIRSFYEMFHGAGYYLSWQYFTGSFRIGSGRVRLTS